MTEIQQQGVSEERNSRTYFSSDFHLGHANIIRYANRPFETVDEMDSTILNNFFRTVRTGDVFYFLGDLSFSMEAVRNFLIGLQSGGIKSFLLLGNHDKALDSREIGPLVKSLSLVRIVRGFMDLSLNKQALTICHYPMSTHHKSHLGAWQLYGHHHTDISSVVQGKKMNVGVDFNRFYPYSFEQIKTYMSTRPDNWDLLKDRDTLG